MKRTIDVLLGDGPQVGTLRYDLHILPRKFPSPGAAEGLKEGNERESAISSQRGSQG
jgi:hypothetical protein